MQMLMSDKAAQVWGKWIMCGGAFMEHEWEVKAAEIVSFPL